MIYAFETERERIVRYMNIPAKKKMEWLRDMQKLVCATSSKRMKKIRLRVRERNDKR